jgi:hypothetical protein
MGSRYIIIIIIIIIANCQFAVCTNIKPRSQNLVPTPHLCLDGEMISVRIVLFGLIVENSMRLVISREI